MSKSLIRKNQLHPDIADLVGEYGSGYFISDEQVVYTSGDQTITGNKTFSASQYLFSGANVSFYANDYLFSGAAISFVDNNNVRNLFVGGNRTLVGNIVNNTNGARLQVEDGITFQATPVLSAESNTLDDYEEGFWTPTVRTNFATPTFLYNSSQTYGSYTKIGNTVFIRGSVAVTGASSLATFSAHQIRIASLPYPSINLDNPVNVANWRLPTQVISLPSFIITNNNQISIGKITGLANAPSGLLIRDITGVSVTGFTGVFSATYRTEL
jgi:hypothetical protein